MISMCFLPWDLIPRVELVSSGTDGATYYTIGFSAYFRASVEKMWRFLCWLRYRPTGYVCSNEI